MSILLASERERTRTRAERPVEHLAMDRQRNLFQRGGVYWGRMKLRGRDYKWSLRTRSFSMAIIRLREERERIMSEVGYGRPVKNISAFSRLLPNEKRRGQISSAVPSWLIGEIDNEGRDERT